MSKEMEWRFLVTRLPAISANGEKIVQAYLTDRSPSVRVRLYKGKAFLAIKAQSKDAAPNNALERHEFEYEIPRADGEALIQLCSNRIEKTRYELPGNIELDIFEGKISGLIIAEIEVTQQGDVPPPPAGWEWHDITSDKRYSNQSLAFNGAPDEVSWNETSEY